MERFDMDPGATAYMVDDEGENPDQWSGFWFARVSDENPEREHRDGGQGCRVCDYTRAGTRGFHVEHV